MAALNEDVNWMTDFTRICNKYCPLINRVLQFQMLHLFLGVLADTVLISHNSDRQKAT